MPPLPQLTDTMPAVDKCQVRHVNGHWSAVVNRNSSQLISSDHAFGVSLLTQGSTDIFDINMTTLQ